MGHGAFVSDSWANLGSPRSQFGVPEWGLLETFCVFVLGVVLTWFWDNSDVILVPDNETQIQPDGTPGLPYGVQDEVDMHKRTPKAILGTKLTSK